MGQPHNFSRCWASREVVVKLYWMGILLLELPMVVCKKDMETKKKI
jgi:hypothetical protein